MNNVTPIDITNIPALRRIVAEMKDAKQPRLLQQENETVAVLLPMGTALGHSPQDIWQGYQSDTVRHALKQSTGILTGVNREELLTEIHTARLQRTHRNTF